jgi:hypothetical protein
MVGMIVKLAAVILFTPVFLAPGASLDRLPYLLC